MKSDWKAVTAVALLGLSLGLLAACTASPYDTGNCTSGRTHCSGVIGNYDSYNWWKTDQESN